MKKSKLIMLAGLLVAASSAQAAVSTTTVIDFSGLSPWSGTSLTVGDVTFDGISGIESNRFDIRTIGGAWAEVLEANRWDATAIGFTFANPVSQFLFNTYGNTTGANWVLDAFDASGNLIDSETYGRITLGATLDTVASITSSSANIAYATMSDLSFMAGEVGSVLYVDNFTYTTPVPEPSTYALMLGGLGMVGFMAYRRRKSV
ncbi:hypothetical protein MNBD_GAMMA04-1588 [hydrothermal vent metagenome]|uniref:Ice-binding protein C-terminal domain-containing protein n=1 Tax=hydrothermal vent metagenome TaxID=652676 RepID=A0A3B0WC68_9ZZZZ